MTWVRKAHEVEPGRPASYYWIDSIPGIGEMCADPLVNGRKWIASAFWWGNDIEISRHATDAEAKRACEMWMSVVETRLANARAMRCTDQPDDGA